MLDRLRPLVLEQMGLCQAIRQLVASWQDRYPNIAWLLMIEADFTEPDEATSLTLYRVAQECATNVIRHADASEVTIRLRRTAEKRKADANTRSPVLLSVQDNGKGLVRNVQYGFGLLGMAERVRQVNGLLRVGNGHPNGVVIEVVIPNQNWPVTMERAHANPAD
jgi:two-component system sensor histidine kinase UhpB